MRLTVGLGEQISCRAEEQSIRDRIKGKQFFIAEEQVYRYLGKVWGAGAGGARDSR